MQPFPKTGIYNEPDASRIQVYYPRIHLITAASSLMPKNDIPFTIYHIMHESTTYQLHRCQSLSTGHGVNYIVDLVYFIEQYELHKVIL